MKRLNNLYDAITDFDNAKCIFNKVSKSTKDKKSICKVLMNENQFLFDIVNSLINDSYKFDNYRIFLIREKKYRIIMSETIKDKVVNHMISNYILLPSLEKSLIDQNVATRKEKGSDYAFNLFCNYINELNKSNDNIYCLKIDISKYFYNIDHEILKEELIKKIKDKKALELIYKIIDSTNESYINESIDFVINNEKNRLNKLNITEKEKLIKFNELDSIPRYLNGKGLPIGNMTSQILAVFYLNDIDHYIKEKLNVKYYIRYMDDLVILDSDKNRLKDIKDVISELLKEKKLTVNKKSNIFSLKIGVSLLGFTFRIHNGKLIIRLKNETARRINRRLKSLRKKDSIKFLKSNVSYKGYYMKCNTNLKMEVSFSVENLYYLVKNNNLSKLVLVKNGMFYKTFDDDAIIMKYLFKYQIINNCLSFPTNIKDKIIYKLMNIGISVIIVNNESDVLIHETSKDNSYSFFLEKSIKEIDYSKKIDNVINRIRDIVKKDEKKLDLLNEFVSSL